jgi:hypothetical protein
MGYPVYKYYVDNLTQSPSSKVHLLHRVGCPNMPGDNRRLYVGHFTTHDEAANVAKHIYSQIGVCPMCSGADSSLRITPDVDLIEENRIIFVKCGRNHNIDESRDLFAKVLAVSTQHGVDSILLDYTDSCTMPDVADVNCLAKELPKHWRMAGLLETSSAITDEVHCAGRLASNHGVTANVYQDKQQAIAWLLDG